MKKTALQFIEETKKKLTEKKNNSLSEGLNHHWETPNQKKAFLDAFSTVEVKDYPIMNYVQSYADFLRSKTETSVPVEVKEEQITDDDINEALEEELKKK